MNVDVFNMLYNLVISVNGQKKFAQYVTW
jgi:hypothetical protein